MKRVLLLICTILPISLNAADHNIHPLEARACPEEMNLLELAAQRSLMMQERSNTRTPAQTFDDNSAVAQEIEKKAREYIEKSAKTNSNEHDLNYLETRRGIGDEMTGFGCY